MNHCIYIYCFFHDFKINNSNWQGQLSLFFQGNSSNSLNSIRKRDRFCDANSHEARQVPTTVL